MDLSFHYQNQVFDVIHQFKRYPQYRFPPYAEMVLNTLSITFNKQEY